MSKAPTPREAAQIRLSYPPGTRIELELMVDAYAVPPGTRGTVDHVDDMGNVHTKWITAERSLQSPELTTSES